LADGVVEYEQARYPEALSTLRQLEGNVATFSPERQARYALYRGLSELSLGNACDAYHWLSKGQRLLRSRPILLDRADRGRLEAAWRALGKMPGQLR
jgi:hypothetical protein